MGREPTFAERALQAFDGLVALGLFLCGFSMFAWGAWLVLAGVYGWMRNGAWPDMSTLSVWCEIAACAPHSWVLDPIDWIGLHKLLSAIPAVVVIFCLGWALVGVSSAISDTRPSP